MVSIRYQANDYILVKKMAHSRGKGFKISFLVEAWKAAMCEKTGVCLFGTSTTRKGEVVKGVFLE